MTYIKKIFINGFKSFGKPTEIVFDKELNVIVGPNGSGKSNIIDALCFVFGRLSSKSMRASRHSNLIYNGGKTNKPANSASVKVVLDNSERTFSIDKDEIEISRTVRKDSTSIYKINGETKTRQEVLELLAEAGIDPHGFNIILQAEIESFVKTKPEEKRKIIEEIAGISIYEVRKEKAFHELEKVEEKLKEIGTILKERVFFMENLEKEREQALRYEFLKKQIRRSKFSLLFKKIQEKEKEMQKADNDLKKQQEILTNTINSIEELKEQIKKNKEKIQEIEKQIEKESGATLEKIRSEILDLRTRIATLEIKKENLKEQLENAIRKKEDNLAEKKRLLEEIEKLEEGARTEQDKSKKERIKYITSEIEKLKQEIKEIELKQRAIEIKKIEIEKKQTILEEKERQKSFLQRQIEELEKELQSFKIEKFDEEEIKN
ncbi:MAG: AAA family ATPase, partial [Candidatus Pacearchaeota archaeon]|nr:AAA family ATPase [Candidatus Pacearchaeota archaeon]